MPQTNNKSKNDNTTPAKVITSPDGTKIQITAGRKLQVIRSFASDPEITDAQFRALVCIIDRLNEGKEGTDESRWGSAYPKFETLARDIAKDERAAKRIVTELEKGKRQTRSGGKTKSVPCKSVLAVQRSKDEGERDNVNEYRLIEWGAFAIDASGQGAVTRKDEGAVTCKHEGKGAVTCQEGCGHLQGGMRSPVTKGAVTAPDSSHLPTSETHLTNPPHVAPAFGERELADLDEAEGRLLPMWASNPEGFRAGDWTWDDREFQPAIDLLGFDEYALDAEINRFIENHQGERRHDWTPGWLEWIQAVADEGRAAPDHSQGDEPPAAAPKDGAKASATDDQQQDHEPPAGQPNDDWPKKSRTSGRLMMHYPCYPGPHKPEELKRVESELKKLRGTVAFQQILDGVMQYAKTQKDKDYRKTVKLSAFLAQRKWEDQGAANDNRQAPERKVSGIDWENDPPF